MLEQALSVFYEFYNAVKPLSIFIIAMVLYAIFVFKFYTFISRRDILKMKDHEKQQGFFKFLAKISSHAVQNLVLIPILVFFWFAIIAGLIMVMARNHTPQTVMTAALAIVATIRITSYYKESLAEDLAKTIPLAMLAVLIVDIGYFSFDNTLALAEQIPLYWKTLVYYMVLVVIIEFVMRVIQLVQKHRKQNIEYRYSQVLK
jgi:hypothetical protein